MASGSVPMLRVQPPLQDHMKSEPRCYGTCEYEDIVTHQITQIMGEEGARLRLAGMDSVSGMKLVSWKGGD